MKCINIMSIMSLFIGRCWGNASRVCNMVPRFQPGSILSSQSFMSWIHLFPRCVWVDAIFMGYFVSSLKLSEFSGSCLRLGVCCLGLAVAKALSMEQRLPSHAGWDLYLTLSRLIKASNLWMRFKKWVTGTSGKVLLKSLAYLSNYNIAVLHVQLDCHSLCQENT